MTHLKETLVPTSALNSTIVRTYRFAWSLSERHAPRLGTRWATRLWFTAPRPIPPDELPAPPTGGSPAGIVLDGRALHGTVWGEGPPVHLLHGWGGRSEQLAAFVRPLVRAGHRVVAVDAPAHGGSGPGAHGRRAGTIPEFAAALRAATDAHGPAHAVVAHSLGAAAAVLALRSGLRPARLVLLAPVADPRRALDTFARRAGFGPRIRAGVQRAVERRVGLPWEAFDGPAAARTVAVPPTLVVHDRGDREVGFRDGREIAEAWPGARLLATDGLGHRRLLHDEAVVAAVVDFVTAPAHVALERSA